MDRPPIKYKQSIISSSLIYISAAAILGFGYLYESRPARLQASEQVEAQVKQEDHSFIAPTFFQSVNQVEVIGAQGRFQLQKSQSQSWKFTGKGRYPAHSNKVIDLLTSFATLKILKTYKLNLSNGRMFGFQRPAMELKLSSGMRDEHIKIGKIDLIRKSAYIKAEDSSKVYEVSFKKFPFHHLLAHDFVQDQVIAFNLDKLENIKITKSKYRRTKINLRKGNERWISSRNKPVSTNKVEQLLLNIQGLKVEAILNQENLNTINIKKFMGRTVYQLELASAHKTLNLKLQRIKKNIPTLTMRTKNKFLLTSNNGDNPMVISKDQLKYFSVSESQLTDLRISDVIY